MMNRTCSYKLNEDSMNSYFLLKLLLVILCLLLGISWISVILGGFWVICLGSWSRIADEV